MDKKMFFKLLSGTLSIATKYVVFVEPLCSAEGGGKISDISKCDEVAIGLDAESLEKSEARLIVGNIPCDEIAKIVIDYGYNQTLKYLNIQDCVNFKADKKIDLNVNINSVVEILSVLVSCLWEDISYVDFNEKDENVFIWWKDDTFTMADVKGMNSADVLYKVFSFCYNEHALCKYFK